MKHLATALTFALITGCVHVAASPKDDQLEALRAEVMRLLDAGDANGLFALYDARMQKALGIESTQQFAANARAAGPYTFVKTLTDTHDARDWHLVSPSGEWRLTLAVDSDGRIAALRLGPFFNGPPLRSSTIPLRLPFAGQWFVVWGGSTEATNKHVVDRNQRRAADILIAHDGKSFRTDGKHRDDYYAEGQPLLAVADGEVVTAYDGLYETDLGVMNGYAAVGNMIILKLQPDLYAMYAHLQPGSLRVHAGDRVTAGQELARCGNAGNTTEPHLHFQLQDGPRLETSSGVEPVFTRVRVTRDGKTDEVDGYRLHKGDLIEQP